MQYGLALAIGRHIIWRRADHDLALVRRAGAKRFLSDGMLDSATVNQQGVLSGHRDDVFLADKIDVDRGLLHLLSLDCFPASRRALRDSFSTCLSSAMISSLGLGAPSWLIIRHPFGVAHLLPY